MSGQLETSVDEERVGRPMRADARRNYDQLVVAARKVFADHGVGASMEAIAKEAGVGVGPPWAALEAWLRAYVDYGRSKRTFLNELHEAFEKNPDLKPASRDRIWDACERVLSRAQEAGVARRDIDGADLMQLVSPMCMNSTLSADQGDRLLTMVLDGLRPPPAQPGRAAPSLRLTTSARSNRG
jgi:AcrR family transcriptional regulator